MIGEIASFQRDISAWYRQNARDLPWRRTRDPYAIWVSEIMLQQTRVAAVMEYYQRFMGQFPTIEALASAPEESVLALWSGLGYYRRARMMHHAAHIVVAEHGGKMPATAAQLRKLPGIGDYTSAAVASISFDEPVPVIDGNVERVLLRLRGEPAVKGHPDAPGLSDLKAAAQELLDTEQPGDFNQAMMELGATVCLPRAPLCAECPVRAYCRTQGEHETGPAKKMRSVQVSYALIRQAPGPRTAILLAQRGAQESQMPGLWELPLVDPAGLAEDGILLTVRHSITNTNYYVTIYSLLPDQRDRLQVPARSTRWISARELRSIPLTGLARKVLKRLKIMPGYTGMGPQVLIEGEA
ncbi:MAG TPA: A/G-specific adenine glycosylase [Acidobacterium sp.]|uniref:Adenine DNA glycosylase n=2 Tax=Acidobacteriaceae TaxID=204434 RepID=C1F8W0_ACIC5|nr:A/G-specific adenine glycosylase, putative [Acidobacterium capsulatum ATCC 51196]HCT59884.1 A/G-specific adenine glycosylase [Acidobacterium sp.]